jgi:hypothetical protein
MVEGNAGFSKDAFTVICEKFRWGVHSGQREEGVPLNRCPALRKWLVCGRLYTVCLIIFFFFYYQGVNLPRV